MGVVMAAKEREGSDRLAGTRGLRSLMQFKRRAVRKRVIRSTESFRQDAKMKAAGTKGECRLEPPGRCRWAAVYEWVGRCERGGGEGGGAGLPYVAASF
jgi:hypothetical protein